MRNLTRNEVVAMWLWSKEYAAQGGGAIEWYRDMPASRVRIVADFIVQYETAREHDAPAGLQGAPR